MDGSNAIPAMVKWIGDGRSPGFAGAVMEAVGLNGERSGAIRGLRRLRGKAPGWSSVVDNAIQRVDRSGRLAASQVIETTP